MTRKHFNALAEALAASKPTDGHGDVDESDAFGQWLTDVDAVARVCQSSNALFDRPRFLAACTAPAYF